MNLPYKIRKVAKHIPTEYLKNGFSIILHRLCHWTCAYLLHMQS